MAALYPVYFSTRQTPQSQPIPGSAQVPNSAGAYAFAVDDWTRLDRFLVLGSEGGSYYADEQKLTIEYAKAVQRCLAADGARTVRRIVEISASGRAPKNDPAVFVLAMAAGMGDPATRAAALAVLPLVCRIGTHLFLFVQYVRAFRGWGRGLRRAIGAWYAGQGPRELAYQLCKYQQRGGWSHRDLLRLAHLRVERGSPTERALAWAAGRCDGSALPASADDALAPLYAFERVKRATTAAEVARLIREHGVVRECVPTRWLGEAEVWGALLERMPLGAMVRNLGTMTRLGLLTPGTSRLRTVTEAFANPQRLRRARLHPVAVLLALRTYAAGRGERGRHAWSPAPQVIDALDRAFYLAFGGIVPAGKRWLLGVDVSGSMGCAAGGTVLSCCEAATAIAMVTVRVEPECTVCAFADQMRPLPIKQHMLLGDALRLTRNVNFGGTDCALPMLYALERRLAVDVFVVLTDSETWAGQIHPVQALQRYRERTGIGARLIVVAMASNGFSIADPSDAGMMDVVGFDAAVPQLMSDFVRDTPGAGPPADEPLVL